ncbi:MAG: hypothetical protein LBK42_01350 [Propionibacteriaceae bacterium]|nr:hypothetical protein [Propionibacteriaceae bacterium]
MNKSDFNALLSPITDRPGYAEHVVYGLKLKQHHWPRWAKPLDAILTSGLVETGYELYNHIKAPGTWFLVAGRSSGAIVRVRLGQRRLVETIPVPDWNPDWQEDFHSVTIGERTFTKLTRERL